MSFRDLSIAQGSPGQVFKLPESDIRERLEALETDSRGAFRYRESASVQQVVRIGEKRQDFLSVIYRREAHERNKRR